MFEVGKTYHKVESSFRVKCLWADQRNAVLEVVKNDNPVPGVTAVGDRVLYPQGVSYLWPEYKEPIKHVRYYNVYPGRHGLPHKTREEADKSAYNDRIGCVRVEFTEGQYDE